MALRGAFGTRRKSNRRAAAVLELHNEMQKYLKQRAQNIFYMHAVFNGFAHDAEIISHSPSDQNALYNQLVQFTLRTSASLRLRDEITSAG